MAERVQKVLAQAGQGSRRQIESWIREGRITINGRTAQLGDSVGGTEVICIDSKKIKISHLATARRRVIIYHKPAGEVCTRSDPDNRATIFTRLPSIKNGRWVAVGRLDVNTSGLMILTTDGELANRLMHPSHEIEREYAVRILGDVDREMLARLQKGVELDDGLASFASIKDAGGQGSNHWYHVILHEGRKREVRRLWESQGVTVSRLIRVRFGNVQLPKGLRAGHFEELTVPQTEDLMRLVGMEPDKKTHLNISRRRSQHGFRKRATPGKKIRPRTKT